MRNKIYISGPITDPATGLPREGWQEAFNAAEHDLWSRGYDVINPVAISKEVQEQLPGVDPIPRAAYIYVCLKHLGRAQMDGELLGVYIIGDLERARRSHGVMCEVNFALSAGIPVFAQKMVEHQVNNELCPIRSLSLGLYTRGLRRREKKYSVRPKAQDLFSCL